MPYSIARTLNDLLPVCALLALAAAILAFIFILPDAKRAKLNKFGQILADICNFRSLLLEQILKFTYIFVSCFIILLGFIVLTEEFFPGLLIMVLGPVVYRILFEFFMMFIILVKNTNEINKKMGFQPKEVKTTAQQTATESTATANTTSSANVCPNCQATTTEGNMFCEQCGYKLK